MREEIHLKSGVKRMYDLPSVGHLHHCFKAILSDRVDLRKCACV